MTFRTWRAARKYGLPPRTSRDVVVDRKVPVPMRDGAVLIGDRYYSRSDPYQPVILIRSPYGRFSGFAMAAGIFAERGFQVFLQSCRGTFGSGGRFDPVRQEPEDGIDTLEWLQCQPWCHGKVHTFGLSYLGFVQWAIARAAGDRLGAMTLHCTLSNFRNEILAFDGLSLEGALGWGTMMAKLTSSKSIAALFLAMARKIDPAVFDCLPLRDLDSLVVGRAVPWWQDWMDHPDPADPWWEAINFTATIPDIATPAAMIGGWYDLFLPWQVNDFELMQAAGRDVWLTIGPWHHFDEEGGAETLRQGLELFSAQAAGRRPFTDRDRVRLFIMGADKWCDFPSWPPPAALEASLYLRAGGALTVSPEAGAADPSRFVYDPADPTPSLHAPNNMNARSKKPDMAALESRSDTLVFTGEPLDADVEIVGRVFVDVHLRSSSRHTDLYACLCEVEPSGQSIRLSDGYPPTEQLLRLPESIAVWPTELGRVQIDELGSDCFLSKLAIAIPIRRRSDFN